MERHDGRAEQQTDTHAQRGRHDPGHRPEPATAGQPLPGPDDSTGDEPCQTGGRWVVDRLTPTQSGLLPDERLSFQIRSELERRGIWTPRLDVTTVDGAVFLRGSESEHVRAETIVSIAREVPGIIDVVDEIRRE